MDFNRSRQVWHDHIARWGGGVNTGQLDRGGVLRNITIAMSEYSPRERGLYADGSVRFMISALGVADADVPDPDLDTIIFRGKRYRITMRPGGSQPDGTWIGFDTNAVFVENIDGSVS